MGGRGRPRPSPSPGRGPRWEKGGARVGRPGLCVSRGVGSVPAPPNPSLDRRAEQPVRAGRLGCGCRNLIRPGGGGGAGVGARGAGGRRPPASPIHSAEPGGRGAPRPALHGGSAGAAPQPARRARPARALPLHRSPRARRAALEPPCPTLRSTRSWTGSFRTLKVGAGRAAVLLGGRWGRKGAGRGRRDPRWGALPLRAPRRLRGGPLPRVSFLLLLFVCAERGQPLRGLLGLPRNYRSAVSLSAVAQPPPSRAPGRPSGPSALRRVRELVTHPCVLPGRTSPSPTPVSGWDRVEFRIGWAAEWKRPGPRWGLRRVGGSHWPPSRPGNILSRLPESGCSGKEGSASG